MPDQQRTHVTTHQHGRIPLGRYRHYKGQYYELIDVARHSETEEYMAVYRTLYGEFDLWVRPLNMFLEEIERDGQTVKRFAFDPEADEAESL